MFKKIALLAATAVAGLSANAASAQCVGTCGTLGPNGVVTAPPAYGPNYSYITTNGGVSGAGQIAGVGGTAGSQFTTGSFAAVAGDKLNFYFNYVTSDGSSTYPDYTFAELLKDGAHAAWLFTARTVTTGNTSPGFGLPANDSVLTPATTAIIPNQTTWSPLGGYSGDCYNAGCGYTGWIQSEYTIGGAGAYQLRFGVTNFSDSIWHSGLAYAGITINDTPVVPDVPEPATWMMMILGFGAVGYAMRRRASVRFANA